MPPLPHTRISISECSAALLWRPRSASNLSSPPILEDASTCAHAARFGGYLRCVLVGICRRERVGGWQYMQLGVHLCPSFLSLYNATVDRHPTPPPYTITLYRHCLPSLYTVALHHHPQDRISSSTVPSLHIITLHHQSVLSLCTITLTLYYHSLPSLCTVTLYRHSTPSLCTVTLYRHFVPSLCTVTLYHHSHSIPSLSTVTPYHHSVPCAITLYHPPPIRTTYGVKTLQSLYGGEVFPKQVCLGWVVPGPVWSPCTSWHGGLPPSCTRWLHHNDRGFHGNNGQTLVSARPSISQTQTKPVFFDCAAASSAVGASTWNFVSLWAAESGAAGPGAAVSVSALRTGEEA